MTDLEKKNQSEDPRDRTLELRSDAPCVISVLPGMHCGINAYVKDGKVIKIEGMDGHPSNDGRLCSKGLANREYIYREDRIKTPLKRVGEQREGKFEPISWDEAYAEIAEQLNKCKKDYGPEKTLLLTPDIPNGTDRYSEDWGLRIRKSELWL